MQSKCDPHSITDNSSDKFSRIPLYHVTFQVTCKYPSLSRSRFLDVTQRSPQKTGCDVRTTFLSHCPCGLLAVYWTDQSHTRKCEWRKVSRENVDVADDLASVTDHVGGNTEENCLLGERCVTSKKRLRGRLVNTLAVFMHLTILITILNCDEATSFLRSSMNFSQNQKTCSKVIIIHAWATN